MSFRAPWLISRRRKLVAIAIDFSIIILVYQLNYYNQFNSNPNIIVSYSVATFWVIISYILGRYMKIRNINLSTFISAAIKILVLFLICISIYLLINWGYSLSLIHI